MTQGVDDVRVRRRNLLRLGLGCSVMSHTHPIGVLWGNSSFAGESFAQLARAAYPYAVGALAVGDDGVLLPFVCLRRIELQRVGPKHIEEFDFPSLDKSRVHWKATTTMQGSTRSCVTHLFDSFFTSTPRS